MFGNRDFDAEQRRGCDCLEILAMGRRDQLFGALQQDAAGAIEYRAPAGGGAPTQPEEFHVS
jgi:hypothetical protein